MWWWLEASGQASPGGACRAAMPSPSRCSPSVVKRGTYKAALNLKWLGVGTLKWLGFGTLKGLGIGTLKWLSLGTLKWLFTGRATKWPRRSRATGSTRRSRPSSLLLLFYWSYRLQVPEGPGASSWVIQESMSPKYEPASVTTTPR